MRQAPSELGGDQTEHGRQEGDEPGAQSATDLDDGSLQRADFSPHLSNILVDPREAGVDSIGKVIKT